MGQLGAGQASLFLPVVPGPLYMVSLHGPAESVVVFGSEPFICWVKALTARGPVNRQHI